MSGSGQETPRQKMIGMMYLFLTAMLAINVSNEVLDAFTIVDNGIGKTIQTIEKKNEITYDDFKTAFDVNPKKVGDNWELAKRIKSESDSLFNHIQNLKWKMVRKSDGEEADISNIIAKDNIDIPAEIMILGKEGAKLKEHINAYKDLLVSHIAVKDSSFRHNIESTLDTQKPPKGKDGIQHSWESLRFSHIPLAGAVTLMSKIQSDIRGSESDIIGYLFNSIEAESFKFNKLKAEVFANSNYILKGSSYEAEIFITAVDTTQQPNIRLRTGQKITNFNKERRGLYTVNTSKVGTFKWGGVIIYRSPSGIETPYPFETEYTVAEPSVVVSATKMNVFYVGVDNPVSISAAGIPADKIKASMTNGRLSKNGTSFIARPLTPGKVAKVTVQAEVDGKMQNLYSTTFRVKSVPDPIPMVGGKKGGDIKKNLLIASGGVDAEMVNFDFDMKFKVTGFTISTVVGGFTQDKKSRSGNFTNDQLKLLKKLKRAQKVYIEDIKAVGPDGATRKLPTLSFKIK